MTQLKRMTLIFILGLMHWSMSYAQEDTWSQSYKLESQKKYNDAVSLIAPIVSKNNKNEFALLRLGWLNYLAGKYNESIKWYQEASDLNAKSIDAKLGLMLPLMAQLRWREATAQAEQVLQVAPWQYYAHVRLMTCEAAQAQWEKLEKHAGSVAQRYPTDADSLVFLARAESKLGKTADAKANYQKVLQMYPDHLEALKYLISH